MHAASSSSIDDGFSQYVCLSVCLSIHRYRAQQQPVQLPIHSSHPMFPLQASFSPAQLSTAQTPPPPQSHSLPRHLCHLFHLISSHPISSTPIQHTHHQSHRIVLPLIHCTHPLETALRSRFQPCGSFSPRRAPPRRIAFTRRCRSVLGLAGNQQSVPPRHVDACMYVLLLYTYYMRAPRCSSESPSFARAPP